MQKMHKLISNQLRLSQLGLMRYNYFEKANQPILSHISKFVHQLNLENHSDKSE